MAVVVSLLSMVVSFVAAESAPTPEHRLVTERTARPKLLLRRRLALGIVRRLALEPLELSVDLVRRLQVGANDRFDFARLLVDRKQRDLLDLNVEVLGNERNEPVVGDLELDVFHLPSNKAQADSFLESIDG